MFNFVACANFNDRFKRHFEQCKEAIQAANNREKSRDVADLLAYEPIYQYTILCTTTKVSKVNLPPLRIKG